MTATYSGPLPGTLCYDGSCQQAAPGYYTAPAEQVIRTWTNTYTKSCPPGYTGSVTVTEQWRTVKYWTPSAGGLSSRGTLSFTSATRDERVSYQEDASQCTSMGYLTLNVILATPVAKPPETDPNPYVQATGRVNIEKNTWGPSTYEVPAGTYTVSAREIEKTFTSGSLSYWAKYTRSINPTSVDVPVNGTGESTVTYTVVNGTFCDYTGCQSVQPGIYSGSGGGTGQPQSDYSSTQSGSYTYTTSVTTTRRTYVHYYNSPYAVSSGQTVNASYTTYNGLIYHRYTSTRKDNTTGETTTIADTEHWWAYGYINYGGGYCWAKTYERARDNVTRYDTGDQYPNQCVY